VPVLLVFIGGGTYLKMVRQIMASAVARAYRGSGGGAPSGGPGAEPPEAGKLWLLASNEGGKLAYFLYLENDNNEVHSMKDCGILAVDLHWLRSVIYRKSYHNADRRKSSENVQN